MRRRKLRRCASCGKVLPSTCVQLCESCQALGMGRHLNLQCRDPMEVLEVAKEREAMGLNPMNNMSMEDIAALAKCYKTPYNTYGKLRAYVESTKKLPPQSFERSEDEIL